MVRPPVGRGLTEREATLPARLAFLSVAVWWTVFAIPLFRTVPEPAGRPEPDERPGESPVEDRIRPARGDLSRAPALQAGASSCSLAFLIYNDGIGTIFRMATIYGDEIGIDQSAMIGAVLLVQFVGIPFAFLFGMLAGRIGAKRSIFLASLASTPGSASSATS